MNIKYIGLNEQHQTLRDEIMRAVAGVLDHGMFILGDEVKRFEAELAQYCETRFAVGVNSGTDALVLALLALKIGTGDEVITVPNSFLATASSIVSAGSTPVFVDSGADMNIDPSLIEAAITLRTRAIIPVHLTGRPADMEAVMEIAKRNDLAVIEDAAQSIGAELNGKKTGSFGHAGCFSMHPLKNLNAIGDAGAVTTDNQEMYNRLKQLRNIGLKNRNKSDLWGHNSRLDTLQAAVLRVKFRYLEQWTEQRRQNAIFYNRRLADLITVPEEGPGRRCVYHTYIIRTPHRDELQKYLEEKGIETMIHYPIPIHLQACARELGYGPGDFPNAERQAGEILSLPIYPELNEEELQYIVRIIEEFFNG